MTRAASRWASQLGAVVVDADGAETAFRPTLGATCDAALLSALPNNPRVGPRLPRWAQLYGLRTARRVREPSEIVARRRKLAAAGPMPPQLATRFTTSELAVLMVIAGQVRKVGYCDLALDTIASRAGAGRTTAQNALRAAASGESPLISVERRPVRAARNLTNVVRIIDVQWRLWIRHQRFAEGSGIGFKSANGSDREGLGGEERGRAERGIAPAGTNRDLPLAAARWRDAASRRAGRPADEPIAPPSRHGSFQRAEHPRAVPPTRISQ